MIIYFGSDHRGFALKAALKQYISDKGYQLEDLGDMSADSGNDFVDFGMKVAERVSGDPEQARGILICGSGAGMDITANKFARVRSVLAINTDQVFDARHDDDVNVLTIASNVHNEEAARKLIDVFIKTPFSGDEKYLRRLNKISMLEHGQS